MSIYLLIKFKLLIHNGLSKFFKSQSSPLVRIIAFWDRVSKSSQLFTDNVMRGYLFFYIFAIGKPVN